MADGHYKSRRYNNAGPAQRNIPPDTKLYLGQAADQVVLDYKQNALAQKQKERQAQVDTATSGLEAGPCDAHLTCNHEVGSTQRDLDEHGLVGVSCIHGFPGKGLFVPLKSQESHYYYDVVLSALLQGRSDLRRIYFDLGCRYSKRFQVILNMLCDNGTISSELRHTVEMVVPWMHAMDHKMECQLQYSGMYRDGAAWRVGEGQEVQWSQMKAVSFLLSFMASPQWWDSVNLSLCMLAISLQGRLIFLMEQKMKKLDVRVKLCEEELRALEAEAAREGVNDFDAAMQVLEAAESAVNHAPSLSKEEKVCMPNLISAAMKRSSQWRSEN